MIKKAFLSLVLALGASLGVFIALAMPPGAWAVAVLGGGAGLFVLLVLVVVLKATNTTARYQHQAEVRRAELAAQHDQWQSQLMQEQALLQRETLGVLGLFLKEAGEREALRDQYYHEERQSGQEMWGQLVQSGQAVGWLLENGYYISQDRQGLFLVGPDGGTTYAAEEFDGLREADLRKARPSSRGGSKAHRALKSGRK